MGSLRDYLVARGVQFTYGKEIKIVADDDVIKHVVSDDGQIISGDKFVVCSGYGSNRLLKSIGLNIPLVHIKSYSLHITNPTVAAKGSMPSISRQRWLDSLLLTGR